MKRWGAAPFVVTRLLIEMPLGVAPYLCLWRQCLLWFVFIPSQSATGRFVPGGEVLGRFAAGGGVISVSRCLDVPPSPRMCGSGGCSGSVIVFLSVSFVALK